MEGCQSLVMQHHSIEHPLFQSAILIENVPSEALMGICVAVVVAGM